MTEQNNLHLLRRLVFPARFEALSALLGSEVARLLVPPRQETLEALNGAAIAIKNRGEGAFVPMYASSGTGKTTLANSLSHFLPAEYAPTTPHVGEITAESLLASATTMMNSLQANDQRVIPINIDDRESNPPTNMELAAIKRFLRHADAGYRCIVLWPETSFDLAAEIAARYERITGTPPFPLPLTIDGPVVPAWPDIAVSTMQLVNNLPSLELLGVNPADVDPTAYRTLGEYLRALSAAFVGLIHDLLRSIQKPLGLVIIFPSASADAGVLSQLTSHSEFGLVDSHALVDATRESVIGRWWAERPGLLTQTIVRLDARAFCLPPPCTISVVRRFGPDAVQGTLDTVGVTTRSEAEILSILARSDFGRFIAGTTRATYETRGTPSTTAQAAFELISEAGAFTNGRDKLLNRAFAEILGAYSQADTGVERVEAEARLDFAPLVPDVALHRTDSVLCIEFAWRSGEFLTTSHRSEIAQYILIKLQNYARELGWF